MKFSLLNRIYTNTKLIENSLLDLTKDCNHYLQTVLRVKINDQLRIFNDIDGEFIAEITNITKNNLSINITNCLRKPIIKESELILGLSLIKRNKMLDSINMAIQLGVTKIIPLIAERSQFRHVNNQKLLKYIIEATEQSERLVPPTLGSLTLLSSYPNQNSDILTLYANENEDESNSLLKLSPLPANISIIIGPEGGFSQKELNILSSWSNSKSVSLGPNILRTETAVAACLAQIELLRRGLY